DSHSSALIFCACMRPCTLARRAWRSARVIGPMPVVSDLSPVVPAALEPLRVALSPTATPAPNSTFLLDIAVISPSLPGIHRKLLFYLAERVGFEPTRGLRPCRFSRPVHSTALPPLRSAGTRREGCYQTWPSRTGAVAPTSTAWVCAAPRASQAI